MKRSFRLALLVCGATLMTACASHNADKSAACSADSMPSIEGEWTVRMVDDMVLNDDSAKLPIIRMGDGQIFATAGCNTMGGNYAYADGVLTIADGMCQTEMWCENDAMMRNERMLGETLRDTLTITAIGQDSLIMRGMHKIMITK